MTAVAASQNPLHQPPAERELRPLGWLGMLLYPFLARRLSGTVAETLQRRYELTRTNAQHQQDLKALYQQLQFEAKGYQEVLTAEYTRLGDYFAWKWRGLDGGERLKKPRVQKVQFLRAVVTPEVIRYLLKTGKRGLLGYRSEIPHKTRVQDLIHPDTLIELTAACRRPVTVLYDKGLYWIEVWRTGNISPIPNYVTHNEMLQHHPEDTARRGTLTLGVGRHREVLSIDLENHPHGVVAGASRGGKSNLINHFLCEILLFHRPEDTKLILIDPKRLEFSYFRGAPHLLGDVIFEVEGAIDILKSMLKEVVRRTTILEGRARKMSDFNKRFPLERMCRIIIVIDELAALMQSAAEAAEVKKLLIQLANLGRAVDIHLILATQLPIVKILPSTIKASMWFRAAARVGNATESITILGRGDAAKIPGIHGRMVVGMDSYFHEIQTPHVQDEDVIYTVKVAKGRALGWVDLDGYQPVINREKLIYALAKNPIFRRQLSMGRIAKEMAQYGIAQRQVQAFIDDLLVAQTFTLGEERYRIEILEGMGYIRPDNEQAEAYVKEDEAAQARAENEASANAKARTSAPYDPNEITIGYPELPLWPVLRLPPPRRPPSDRELFEEWLHDCCIVDWNAKTSNIDLAASYEAWCTRHSYAPVSQRQMSLWFGDLEFRATKNLGMHKGRGWQGIRIKEANS